MTTVLVTGASGFVGRALCPALAAAGYSVIAASRQFPGNVLTSSITYQRIGDMSSGVEWGAALEDVDVVIHLAARVHVMKDDSTDPLTEFREINTKGTKHLARSAAQAGVSRLIYLSTIKVLGEGSPDRPFSHTDVPSPCDPYAISKYEAEQALVEVASESSMEFTILRPPLIYGAGVRGNLRRVLDLVRRRVPVPVGRVNNKRSMLALGNLCDAVELCIHGDGAGGQTLLLADDAAISTPELFETVGRIMDRPARLLSVPVALLKLIGTVTGKSGEVSRLCESLEVDIEYTKNTLAWKPATVPEEGLRQVVSWYLEEVQEKGG